MPRFDPNDTWVMFDTLRRKTARKPCEDIRLAINAEINAEKAARRAKTDTEWQAAMAKEEAARAMAAKAIVSARVWDDRPNPWAKEKEPQVEGLIGGLTFDRMLYGIRWRPRPLPPWQKLNNIFCDLKIQH